MASRTPHAAGRREQTDAERRAAVDALRADARRTVAAVHTGDQWSTWLRFAARFPGYSLDNIMLIWAQRPAATSIASYRTWAAQGRQVRKGEKSLRTLAPIPRRTPVRDSDGRTVRDEHGHAVVREAVTAYRPAPVFDLSQTYLPAPTHRGDGELRAAQQAAGASTEADRPGLWAALVADAAARGYRVQSGDLAGTASDTDLPGRTITVDYRLPDAEAVHGLAHALAHTMLHSDDTDAAGRVECRGRVQVEADSAAYLLTAYHGGSPTTVFPATADWAYGPAAAEHVDQVVVVQRSAGRVVDAGSALIAATAHADSARLDRQPLAARADLAAQRCDQLRDNAQALAARAGSASLEDRAVIAGVLADTHDYFRRHLGDTWVPAYLDSRGLTAATLSHELGHAPAGWTGLTGHLHELGYADNHLEAAGVAVRARTGMLVDRFRDRLMLPVHDSGGDLVGFVGRSHPDSAPDTPRYLNTPSTDLYSKSDVLYGLGPHRAAIRDGYAPVICEGPLDAVAVDLAARHSTVPLPVVGVAASGTAFTASHAAQVAQLVEGRIVYLAFDGDDPGRAATAAAWRRLTDAGVATVRAADLPPGTDPADQLRAGGPGAIAETILGARPAATVVADHRLDAVPKLDGDVGRQLSAYRTILASQLDRVPATERAAFVAHLSDRLDIDPATADLDARPGAASRTNTLTDRVAQPVDRYTGDPPPAAATATASVRADR